MKTTKYILYWAHLPEHTNPLTEGYIGITKQSLKDRVKNHKYHSRKGSNNLFKQKIREYDNLIIWEVIGRSFSKTGAQTIEKSFRPTQNIAWNTQEGGGDYPIFEGEKHPLYGTTRPDYVKNAVSLANKGKVWTQEEKIAQSKRLKGKNAGIKNHFAKLSLNEIDFINSSNISSSKLALLLNVNVRTINRQKKKFKQSQEI